MFDTHLLHKNRIPNINSKYRNENTVLHLSCLYNRYELAATLIELGGDIEATNKHGRTPLHVATIQRNTHIVDLLLSSGANIDCVDSQGYTPLMHATLNCDCHSIQLLLLHNADVSIRNAFNQNCFDLIRNKRIFDLYLQYFPSIRNSGDSYTHRLQTNTNYYHMCNRKSNILTIMNRLNTYNDLLKHSDMFYREINATNVANAMYNKLPQRLKLSDFDSLQMLGKGGFGEVHLVQLKKTSNMYALKAIDKKLFTKAKIKRYIENERRVYEKFHSPFIVTFYRAFQSPSFLCLLIEYMQHGDLKAYIKKHKRFSENEVKLISAQLILALEHLHKQGIIYRDLKPDNILIDSEGYIKLGDFGLCKEHIIDNCSTNSFCGSIMYMAPEVINREGHGRAIDWYLLGTVMYELLTGAPPFFVRNNKERIMDNIVNAKLRFKFEEVELSEQVVDLLRKLLNRDVKKRIGASFRDSAEIKEHPFYKGINFESIYNKKFIPPFQLREAIVKPNRDDSSNSKQLMEEMNVRNKCFNEDNNNNEWQSNEEDTGDRSRSHSGNKDNEIKEGQMNFVEGWDFQGVFSKNGE